MDEGGEESSCERTNGCMGQSRQSCDSTSGKHMEVRGEMIALLFIIFFGKKYVSLQKGEDKNKTHGFKLSPEYVRK